MKTQKDYVQELDEVKALQGWNDIDLAKQLETTSAMISKWRTGKSQMTAKTKNRIINLFQRLATTQNPAHSNTSCYLSHCPAEPPVDRFLQVILESWERVDTKGRAEIAGRAAELAEQSGKSYKAG